MKRIAKELIRIAKLLCASPAPDTLYHVTPYAKEVLKYGFKRDMPQLFGGDSKGGVSFGSYQGAKNYAKALGWMLRWYHGEISFDYQHPNSIYKAAKEFGIDGIGVQEAIGTALDIHNFSFWPDDIFKKDSKKYKAFIYDVFIAFGRLSKGKFPWIFKSGIENMVSAGKTADDINILKISFGSAPEGFYNPGEEEWRVEHEIVNNAKIEIVD